MNWPYCRVPKQEPCIVCSQTVVWVPIFDAQGNLIHFEPSSRYWTTSPNGVFCSVGCSWPYMKAKHYS